MKVKTLAAFVAGLVCGATLIAAPGGGAGLQSRPRPKAGERAKGGTAAPSTPKEEVHQGELERALAIGGETTGWRLRVQTPQGPRSIEVQLTPEQAKSVKTGVTVVVRGTMETRHYVERGDVRVLVAKDVLEVANK